MRVLVTRPEPDASDTARRFAALGFEPIIWPLLEMEILATTLPADPGWRALALTSVNGVRALAARGDVAALAHLPVFAVGDRTAEAARALGFTTVTSARGGGAKLAERMIADGAMGPVLYPAAEQRSFDLEAALAGAGIELVTCPVYRMVEARLVPGDIERALQAETISAVTLYSRRTAECFMSLVGSGMAKGATAPNGRHRIALCLSAAVAEGLGDAHLWDIRIAATRGETGMMALADALRREGNGAGGWE